MTNTMEEQVKKLNNKEKFARKERIMMKVLHSAHHHLQD